VKEWTKHVELVKGFLITDCRGDFDALSRSESSGFGMKVKRAGMDALALRRAMAST
jgi:hypothetical protein